MFVLGFRLTLSPSFQNSFDDAAQTKSIYLFIQENINHSHLRLYFNGSAFSAHRSIAYSSNAFHSSFGNWKSKSISLNFWHAKKFKFQWKITSPKYVVGDVMVCVFDTLIVLMVCCVDNAAYTTGGRTVNYSPIHSAQMSNHFDDSDSTSRRQTETSTWWYRNQKKKKEVKKSSQTRERVFQSYYNTQQIYQENYNTSPFLLVFFIVLGIFLPIVNSSFFLSELSKLYTKYTNGLSNISTRIYAGADCDESLYNSLCDHNRSSRKLQQFRNFLQI